VTDTGSPREPSFEDLRVLSEASKSLLGYFVERWFNEYFTKVNNSLARQYEEGLLQTLTEPTDKGRGLLFDFRALDLDDLNYLVGIYLYVYLCHKSANFRLLHRFDGKQVLFLRGYDFEGAIASHGSAVGAYTTDTRQFGAALRRLLPGGCSLFTVISPMDLWWDTIDAQRYFNGDYAALQQLVAQRPASVYLNADAWQEGVADLLDRMDHYVVYVSSITESALWELEQLDTDARRDRVTVVFDEQAIADKEGRAELPGLVAAKVGWQVTWTKPGAAPAVTAADLRKHLSQRFHVTTEEEFEAHFATHLERITASASPLAPGARETWIDFRFHPAVGPDELDALRDIAAGLEAEVSASMRAGIDCLPLFLAHVQLRIYATLLVGRHDETGRALAVYAGIMHGAREHYGDGGELSPENRERLLWTLQQHEDMGKDAGMTLLGAGKSHEFKSIYAEATATFDAAFDATTAAVAECFAQRE
jgi:hypothetical protein